MAKRRIFGAALCCLLTLGPVPLVVWLADTADAVTVGSGVIGNFEEDGNQSVEVTGRLDWSSVSTVVVTDDAADSGFTQGSKELEPGAWVCGTGGANPNKGNILRAYVNPRVDASGVFVDLGWVREGVSGGGDVHLNFEFNQQGTASSGVFAPGPCPVTRVAGDLLVTYDFPGGNADPNIQFFSWLPTTPGTGTWVDMNLPASAARAAVNQSAITDAIVGGTVDTLRFGEATIDLAAALAPDANADCRNFGLANIRSRSSGESITSALQDKLPGTAIDLSTCGKIRVHKTDDHEPARPLAGAVFGLSAAADPTGAVLQRCTSVADGSCTFDDVKPGTYLVKELEAPAGYDADPRIEGPVLLVTRGLIDIARPFVDPRQTGSVRIVKALRGSDGKAVVPDDSSDLDGAAFVVYSDDGDGVYEAGEAAKLWPAQTQDATCAISGGKGSCDVGPVEVGSYRVHETVAPSGTTAGPDVDVVVTKGTTPVTVTYANSVPDPGVEIVKSGPALAHDGDTVTYTFKVTNIGRVALTDVSVTDDKVGPIGTIASLAPGESKSLSKDFAVPAGSADYCNVASASGTDRFGRTVSDTDSHCLDRLHPRIAIDKKVNGADHKPSSAALDAHAGDALSYTVKVTNTGDTALEITALSDTLQSSLGCSQGVGSTLAAGASFGCAYTRPAADEHNVVRVTGRDGLAESVSASDETYVGVLEPGIKVEKSGPGSAHDGDVVTYTFKVTNTGNTDLSDVAVSDDKVGAIGTVAALAAGASATLHADFKVPAGSTDFCNVATASGADALGRTVSDTDSHCIDRLHPAINVVKAGPATFHAGDRVTYTFEVTNTGDVDLSDVDVTDDALGAVGTIASLPVGESRSLSKDFTIPAGDDNVVNTVTACGTDPLSRKVCDTDRHEGDPLHPAIAIDKKVNGADHKPSGDAMLAHAGDGLSYTVKVTNTGDTSLRITALSDTLQTALGCSQGVGSSLAAGASFNCAYTRTASDDEHNVAAVTGVDSLGGVKGTVSASDETFVDVIAPAVTVSKDGPARFHEGDTVIYTFSVKNTGDVELSDVRLTDDVLGSIGSAGSLQAGESKMLTKSFTIPAGDATVTNTVTACGNDPLSKQVCDTDSHEGDPLHPAITIDKKVNGGDHKAAADALTVHQGDELRYTVVVTNTGDATLTITELQDTLKENLVGSCDAALQSVLALGGKVACSYVQTAAQDAHNVASVRGVDVLKGAKGSVSASDETFVKVISPAIGIVKDGPALAHEGDLVIYTFAVTNSGDATLKAVAVTDDVLGAIGNIETLAAGQTSKLSKEFTVPAGKAGVKNTATACGTDELAEKVCDDDTHTLQVVHPAITIVKTADPVQISGSGQVTYTYVVTNTGDVTLSPVSVIDDVLGAIGTIPSLEAGKSATLTRSITANVQTPPRNIGTATGADPLGKTVSAQDDATISVVLAAKVSLPNTGLHAALLAAIGMFLVALGLALAVDKPSLGFRPVD